MVNPGGSSGPNGGSDRCVTPIIGLVLLIGMVAVGASAIFLTAGSAVDDAESQADAETAEMKLKQVDQRVATMTFGDKAASSIRLENRESGEYDIVDDGRLNVTVRNGFGSACSTEYSLQSLQYEAESGDTIGYQAGGIWRNTDRGGTYISAPDLRYFTETSGKHDVRRLDFQLTNLDGEVRTGDHTARQRLNDDSYLECLGNRTFGYAQRLELTVSGTQFHEGWYQFLRAEFDAVDAGPDDDVVIEHDPDDREVTVTAPLDYDRPFVHYVNVEQTIYGGVYVDATDEEVDGRVAVDGYDGHENTYAAEPNVSPDLYVADTNQLTLKPLSTVVGHVVSNGDLKAQSNGMSGANVSEYAFYAGTEKPPGSDDVVALDISERFDEVKPVDDDIDLAHSFLQGKSSVPASGQIDAGLYHDGGDLTLSNRVIDTTDGDVHVAVDGELTLSDVTVQGPNTVYFYVDGSDIDVTGDVSVPDDRAKHLWVYGSSAADVTIGSSVEFQGVLYAPASDDLTIGSSSEIYGAVVGGEGDIGWNVDVHFDRSLRTDVPIPPQDRTQRYVGERDPLDVSFVLDRSSSMGNRGTTGPNDPDKRRVDATRNFIDKLDEDRDDYASVFEFNHTGDTLHEMDDNLTSVNESVEGGEFGYTNMSAGMVRALDQHEAVDTPGHPLWNPTRDQDKVMVLLSDGENNFKNGVPPSHPFYGNETKADEVTMEQAERAADMGVTIYTVGLGYNNLDEALLQDVADETGGKNININDSDRLEEVFETIAADVMKSVEVEFDTYPRDPVRDSNRHVVNLVRYEVEFEDG